MAEAQPKTESSGCPECGASDLVSRRSVPGVLFGALFVMIGFLASLATLGASFILAFVGVFMIVERQTCRACGWRGRI